MPSHTFLWKAVNNFGHVPLFGLVAIVLLWMSRMLSHSSGRAGLRHYGIAMIGVLVLALLTESLQSLTVTRSSTLTDVVHDLLGATCGLVLFFTCDAHLTGAWVQWRQFPRNFILRVCVMIVVGITLFPVLKWSYSYWERANRFPSMLEFTSDRELDFVKASGSQLQVVPPPLGWKQSSEDLVGLIMFYPMKYPGIRLEEPYPDWQGYTYLRFDMYSELSHSQPIGIRIDDTYRTEAFNNRFNRRIMILPGINHIQIPLEDIRQAPESREMDLSTIRRMLLFAVNPAKQFTLYFDNLRLE